MSLKTEQRLNNGQFTEFAPRIYSTGVHLVPMELLINGVKQFIWVADDFNGETYLNGKLISPQIQAKNIVELLDDSDNE